MIRKQEVFEVDIPGAVEHALETLEDEFRNEPTLFFTEHDLVSKAYQLIQQELGEAKVCGADGKIHYLVHHEYPTPFRCDMSGKGFVIKDEIDRTPRGSKYQRGHYDLVIFNPDYLKRCEYELAKGQNYKKLKLKLSEIIDATGAAAIVVGIEFMFNRDNFSSVSSIENWWAGVMQDYQKLLASKSWHGRPFMDKAIMMAFDASSQAGRHVQVKEDLSSHSEIQYCSPQGTGSASRA